MPSRSDIASRDEPTLTDDDEKRIRFGYRAKNFRIRHHEVWDAFYPLYHLTRSGGPLFKKCHDRARIRFEYPIPLTVRDFFIQRAADFGIHIDVEAPVSDARLGQPTSGHVLSFGGGKDSRLILGLLRETGVQPTMVMATGIPSNAVNPPPPGALVVDPIHRGQPNRLMPGFMQLGRHHYVGADLGGAHRTTPWQHAYDYSSMLGRRQMTDLMSQLGVEMEFEAPVVVLPQNIIQRILHDRYPELYAGQVSTAPDARWDKNLRIALLKMYHQLPRPSGISDTLFRESLVEFVRRQTADPNGFGFHDGSKYYWLEMRSVIWRLRNDPALAPVRDEVPPEWDGPWIDYIHSYVDTDIDPAWLAIYREYAPSIEDVASSPPIHRLPI